VKILAALLVNFHFLNQDVISFNNDWSFSIDELMELSCVRIAVSSANIASCVLRFGDVVAIDIEPTLVGLQS